LRQPGAAGAGADGENPPRRSALFAAGGEGPYRAERDGDDAVVLGRVDPGRTCALRLGERDRLTVEIGHAARVGHLSRGPEACHWVPIGVRAHDPQVEARMAGTGGIDLLAGGAAAAAEYSAGDNRVVVTGLAVGAVHRGREVGQPEVLVACARRP